MGERTPVVPTGVELAGITGYDPLQSVIRGRDERGMAGSRRSFAPVKATEYADLQGVYGSDGT
jgi:hypothetical protein